MTRLRTRGGPYRLAAARIVARKWGRAAAERRMLEDAIRAALEATARRAEKRGYERGRGMKSPFELALTAAMETLTNTLVVAGHYFEKHEGHPDGCLTAGCRPEDYHVWQKCAVDEVRATLEENRKSSGGKKDRTVALLLIRGGKGG